MKRMLTALLCMAMMVTAVTSLGGECGDINLDNNVDILDIVYLINFKYKSGPVPLCDGMLDIDGNIYETTTIGSQVWMAENLKVTHYRNGDPIYEVNPLEPGEWSGLSTGAFIEFDNYSPDYIDNYGLLYNWYAVNDSRNIAPAGWHVPTLAEWQTLIDYLGGSSVAGGKMKEEGTTFWGSPNAGATNESGFTGRPAGTTNSGEYADIEYHAYFWSATETDFMEAQYTQLQFSSITTYSSTRDKNAGMSIRCIKD
ncbi:MAG: hypothetical protein GY865_17415 [candidate division Zixibacteria bacterium]|nr:hypothetical protein [candidate division Zixibacteria bacterium]